MIGVCIDVRKGRLENIDKRSWYLWGEMGGGVLTPPARAAFWLVPMRC